MADLEYAKRGLVGVLTPQANTTVEPEFNILWPDGVGMINARMTSDKGTIVDRLYDYVDQIEATFDRFANAPIDAACFGCTGASYLIGRAREKVSSFWSTRTCMPSSCSVRVCRRSDRSWMLPTGPAPLSRHVCSASPGVRCYTSTVMSRRKPICWPGVKELPGTLASHISNPLETKPAWRSIAPHLRGRL